MRSISNMSKNCNDSFQMTAFKKSWLGKIKSPLKRRVKVLQTSNLRISNRLYPMDPLSSLNRKNQNYLLASPKRNKKLAFSRKTAEQSYTYVRFSRFIINRFFAHYPIKRYVLKSFRFICFIILFCTCGWDDVILRLMIGMNLQKFYFVFDS